MTDGFPKQTRSQAVGEIGVDIVSLGVRDSLGWMFRRTPQESDFGVDGYIDLLTDTGHVTGKSLAVQIKTGDSYLKRGSDSTHWVYAGDLKHVNYYLNHTSPVLLLLVDPNNRLIWWHRFIAYETNRTPAGWTIAIPKSSVLNNACKAELRSIAGGAEDYLPHLEEIWGLPEKAKSNDLILFIVSRLEIETENVRVFELAINRLRVSEDALRASMNKVDFLIGGYDDDPRDLFEIPEVRLWVQKAIIEVKHFAYFFSVGEDAQATSTIACCLCGAKRIDRNMVALANPARLVDFMNQQFAWLNELTEKHGIDDLNKPVSMRFARKIREILGASDRATPRK